MGKSSKKSADAAAGTLTSAAKPAEAQNGNGAVTSEKTEAQKPAPASTKPPRKRASATGRKTATTREGARKSTTKKKAAPAQVAVSEDEIRLRAYFLAEQRLRAGIEGDTHGDWLEARRQLLTEAAGRA